MKNSTGLFLSEAVFIPRRFFPAFLIGVFVLGIGVAHATPLATSEVYVQVGHTSTENASSFGPVETELNKTNPFYGVYNWGLIYGDSISSGYSTATTEFGSILSDVGKVSVESYANASGYRGETYASATSLLTFHFTIIPKEGAPTLSSIPIYFEASGVGDIVKGSGHISATAFIQGPSYNWNANGWYISQYVDGSFDKSVTLSLQPGYAYPVFLNAAIYTSAFSSSGTVAEGQVTASVDPIIRLDQEAFEALYPGSNLKLSDYYTLEFSPNLAVPEPGILILLGISMASIFGLRRWWKD